MINGSKGLLFKEIQCICMIVLPYDMEFSCIMCHASPCDETYFMVP